MGCRESKGMLLTFCGATLYTLTRTIYPRTSRCAIEMWRLWCKHKFGLFSSATFVAVPAKLYRQMIRLPAPGQVCQTREAQARLAECTPGWMEAGKTSSQSWLSASLKMFHPGMRSTQILPCGVVSSHFRIQTLGHPVPMPTVSTACRTEKHSMHK